MTHDVKPTLGEDRPEDWFWMPHTAHFICGNSCRFHMATVVGNKKFIVSTVGEYLLPESLRDVLAEGRGISLEGKGDAREADWINKNGFEKLGADDRLYETMVFAAKPNDLQPKFKCCPYLVANHSELDMLGTNFAPQATLNHYLLCKKWERNA